MLDKKIETKNLRNPRDFETGNISRPSQSIPVFLCSRLALSRVQHWSLLQCPVINQCVASMRVHYSCPPTPLLPHIHPRHSVAPSGWFCGRFYSFFVVYVCSFLFLSCLPSCTNTMMHWQLVLHNAVVVLQPVVWSVRLGFRKSWVTSLVLDKSTI
jgi:hypothetical protein